MVNVLINIVERYDQMDVGHAFDYNSAIYVLDVTYHELAASLGYLTLDYKVVHEINSILDNLSKTHANIFYTHDGDRFMENTTFLLKYVLSTTNKGSKRDLDKRFSIMLSTSLVKIMRENKELFKRFYTHDRYDLRGKYTTVLYDTLSARAKGSNTIGIDYALDELVNVIDFELEETCNIESWAKINSNILKRSSKEINEKTNMYISYDKVKNKIGDTNRMQTMAIRFEISLAPEMEETSGYFTDDFLMERKTEYYMEKEVNRKVIELKKFNDMRIKNEDQYRFIERQKLMKQKDEFQSKVKIQEFLNWVKYNNPDEHGLVCLLDYEDHNYVTVNSEHLLADVDSRETLSKNACDTYVKIQRFLDANGECVLVDAHNIKEYSISYSKG